MALVVTGLQVRTAVRQLADVVNNNVVTDSEVDARVNEGISELYDLVVGTYENYFLTPATFTLAGGVNGNSVVLPADFYKDLGVDEVTDPANPITIHAGTTFLERNRTDARRYWFDGGQLVIRPARQAAGKYSQYYTPLPPVLNDPLPKFTVKVLTLDALPTPNVFAFESFTQSPLSAPLVVEGTPILVGDMVGVFGESDPTRNMIYTCQQNNGSGWQLSPTVSAVLTIALGDSIGVSAGATNANKQFRITSTSASINLFVNPLNVVETHLPQVLLPWYQYPQIHGAIAVKEKREQDTGDLEMRLARQTKRVESMAANRRQEGGQIALTRRDASWTSPNTPGVDGAGWGP